MQCYLAQVIPNKSGIFCGYPREWVLDPCARFVIESEATFFGKVFVQPRMHIHKVNMAVRTPSKPYTHIQKNEKEKPPHYHIIG